MMGYSRNEILQRLLEFTGPLGPFVTPDQLRQRRRDFLEELDETDLPLLAEIAENPPSQLKAVPEELELEIADAVAAAGRSNQSLALNLLARLLSIPNSRSIAITSIGALGAGAGVQLLQPLWLAGSLNDDDAERAACALGDIGTP